MKVLKTVMAFSLLLSSPLIAIPRQEQVQISNPEDLVDDVFEIIEEIQYEQEEPAATRESATCVPHLKSVLKKLAKAAVLIGVLVTSIIKR